MNVGGKTNISYVASTFNNIPYLVLVTSRIMHRFANHHDANHQFVALRAMFCIENYLKEERYSWSILSTSEMMYLSKIILL